MTYLTCGGARYARDCGSLCQTSPMPASCRSDGGVVAQSLHFRLPDSASKVRGLWDSEARRCVFAVNQTMSKIAENSNLPICSV